MTRLIFVDTETVGLAGPCMLIQYAEGTNGEIKYIKAQQELDKVKEFETLIDDPNITVCAYNAPFDIAVLYRTFTNRTERLKCNVLCLQNHAKLKHPLGKFTFQRTGERAIASLKRIPAEIAEDISDYITKQLQKQVPKEVTVKGSIHKCTDKKNKLLPQFKNLSFSITANFRLKTLMKYYGHEVQQIEDVWPIPKKGTEKTHDPSFQKEAHEEVMKQCTAILNYDDPRAENFWKYATDDVKYIQELYLKLGSPEPDYNDSVSHIVGFTYHYGFELDTDILNKMKKDCEEFMKECENMPFNINSSVQKLAYFKEKHPKMSLKNCDKYVLKKLASKGDTDAQQLMDYGATKQMYDQCIKLHETTDKKGHPNFRVIGTATQRMAGSGGFNWQGIGKKSPVRKAVLSSCGGDFSGLEIGLMAIIYEDEQMQADLREGKDIHLATAIDIHPKLKGKYTYEEAAKIRAEEYPKEDFELIETYRGETKGVVFGSAYGAEAPKIAETIGVTEILAEELLAGFYTRYSGIKEFKKNIEEQFTTGDTENWCLKSVSNMSSTIEDKLDYTRTWEFESQTADYFWRLSKSNCEEFNAIFEDYKNDKIIRNKEKGNQTYRGAVMSALLGSALTIQKSVARTAINSIVQSAGAQLTKRLMARIWDNHGVPMLNVHDEIIVARHPNADYEKIHATVQNWISEWKLMFPFLGMDFKKIDNWGER